VAVLEWGLLLVAAFLLSWRSLVMSKLAIAIDAAALLLLLLLSFSSLMMLVSRFPSFRFLRILDPTSTPLRGYCFTFLQDFPSGFFDDGILFLLICCNRRQPFLIFPGRVRGAMSGFRWHECSTLLRQNQVCRRQLHYFFPTLPAGKTSYTGCLPWSATLTVRVK